MLTARTRPRCIFIHGNGGCTAGDLWFPWLERELTALGLDVINRTFPDNVKARARYWLPFIAELGADERTILVGHSSGAVAAMRFAETHRLLGSVLVAVCHSDLGDAGEAASGYYRAPWAWDRIRANQDWLAVYHSADDPLIPVAEARFVASQLKASYYEFEDRGHFSAERTFPEVLDCIRNRSARP